MFNQFTSVYIDTISAKKARLGSTSNWYPSYDSSDPKLVRWGGLSFSGSDIVYVTPYDAEVDSIVFNYDFTVEVVFKPTAVTSNKQYMLYITAYRAATAAKDAKRLVLAKFLG